LAKELGKTYIESGLIKGAKETIMRMFSVVIAFAVTLTIAMMAPPTASARGGMGGGGGGAGLGGHAPTWQGSSPPGFSQGTKTGWRGGSVPPGWSKGKKTGWNGRGVPPGLYGR
jgi:hypothetical protein